MELPSHHHHEEDVKITMPINSSFVGVNAHHGHILHGHITHHSHHHHHNQHNNITPPFNNSNGGTSSTITATKAAIMEDDIHHHKQHLSDINDHNSNDNNDDDDDLGSKMMNNKMIIRYRECQKNHAATIGGNATDGCGEFMPSGEEGTLESLTCSACNCHRNFHRKEIQGEHHHNLVTPLSTTHAHFYPSAPHPYLLNQRGRKVILGGTPSGLGYPTANVGPLVPYSRSQTIHMSPATYTLSDQDHYHTVNNGGGMMNMVNHQQYYDHNPVVKKRFRTKFSQDQKEKMLEFAEKVGWKFQKHEESVVQQFCQEIGVKRKVLKVWMHNNKHHMAKKNDINTVEDNIVNHPS